MNATTRVSRRLFLRISALLGAGSALLAACQQASAPAPAPKTEPKPTDAPKPAEAKPAPTTQPAAAVKPTEAPKPAVQPTAFPAAAPAAAKAVTIQYWHINTEVFGLPTIREQIAAFKQIQPGITVEERSFPNSYVGILEALQAGVVGRNLPAVVQVGFGNIPYVAENIPHTPIERLAQQEPEALRDFPDAILGLGRTGGVVAGMPYSLSLPITFLNGDVLEAAGLDPAAPPTTWDQLRAAARTIKEKTGKFGVHIVSNSPVWTAQSLIEGNGGRILDTDGTTAVFDSPEAAEVMQFWADLGNKDRTLPIITFREARQSFASGDIAMVVDASSSLSQFSLGAKYQLLTAPYPLFGSKPRRASGGGNCLFVTAAGTDQQAAAWEWVKYLTSSEQMTLWVKDTGYLPIRSGLEQDPRYLKSYYDENPLGRAGLSQLSDAVPWAAFPGKNGPQAASVFQEAQDAIMSGQADPQSALREAASKINALIRA